MGVKSTPLAIKVAIYHQLLDGHMSRAIGRQYVISQPTILKYANDAVSELRKLEVVENSPALVNFLSRTVKMQCFQYLDDESVRGLMSPILEPYLSAAEKINYAGRESADQALSTRVSRTTEEEFQSIVSDLAASTRPGLTSSALLRELVEDYVARSKSLKPPTDPSTLELSQDTPAPAAPTFDKASLLNEVLEAVRAKFDSYEQETPPES